MLAKTKGKADQAKCRALKRVLANASKRSPYDYKNAMPIKRPLSWSYLPPRYTRAVHHALIVPTLSLTTKQSVSDSGIALLLVLHSRLQDTRVGKID